MNDFEIIAFDLDDTLAESKAPLDPEMAELLCALLKQKKVVVASGASFTQLETQFLAHFSCDEEHMKNLYLLPTSGSSFYEYKEKWQPLYEIKFSSKEAKQILDALEQSLKEGGYVQPEKIYGELIENRGSQITFSACGQDAPLEIKKTWDSDHQKRERIVKILQELLPELSIRIGGTNSIDITKKGIDKAYGLTKVMEYVNCPKERILYVGDALFPGGNDSAVLTLDIQCKPVSGVLETKQFIRNLALSDTLLKN